MPEGKEMKDGDTCSNGQVTALRRRPRVLFVAPTRSPFILQDLELLRRSFDVREIFILGREQLGKRYISGNVPNLIPLMQGMRWADVVFSWFADFSYWPVRLAKRLGKRTVVVLGGYDVAAEEEFHYGALLSEKGKHRVRAVLTEADALLPVDGGLCTDVQKNLSMETSRFRVLPTGYDPNLFFPEGVKERSVLTVASGSVWSRARIKGLDMFVSTAELLPEFDFNVVGLTGTGLEHLQGIASPNVKFLPGVAHDQMPSLYQRAKVYAQLSYREGLPNAVCESMLCECVIVGSDIPGIKTAVGDTGLIVPYGDVQATASAIKRAMEMEGGPGRKRIMDKFSLDRRGAGLNKIIDEVLALR